MSFLDKAFESGAPKPEPIEQIVGEEKEPPTGEPEKEKEVIAEEPKTEPVKEEVKEEIKEEPKAEPAAPTKKEVDYKEWLEQHESTLRQYLNEKNTDYTTLPQIEVVKRKIQADNPEFNDEDVENELEDKYGLSLSLIEIDPDVMDEAEIAEAKRLNKETEKAISKFDRALKKDATQAVKYFNELKGSLELPKFELDVEPVEAPKAGETFNPETYQEQLVEAANKNRDEVWIPAIKEAIEPLEALTEQVEYEDNGNKVVLAVNYKLSKDEKAEILTDLSDYISKPSDVKYVNAQGETDVQRFVQDRAKELLQTKLLKTVAKEAAANARKEFVKNDLLNYDDSGKERSNPATEEPFFKGLFQAGANANSKRL